MMDCVGSGGKGPGMNRSFLILYFLLVLFRGSYRELCARRTNEVGDFLSVCKKVWRGPSVLFFVIVYVVYMYTPSR